MIKPLLVSSGEPAGIGPDICLALAKLNLPIVILGDRQVLQERAQRLNLTINFLDYTKDHFDISLPNTLFVISIPTPQPVTPGKLNPLNSTYVLKLLSYGTEACLRGDFSGLVTAPVNKAVINQANIPFTGHTEFLAQYCQVKTVVMMLACESMKVALVTTHLPLKDVPQSINKALICNVIETLNDALKRDFGIIKPQIFVAGLNPHAGEGGYLGHEEIEIINPALRQLRAQGIHVEGPFPADTLFVPNQLKKADAFVAMYHDQGLPVLKYAGFGHAVNITLGLPIIRTSVDHGTALELAGTGQADTGSLIAAVEIAKLMVEKRASNDDSI